MQGHGSTRNYVIKHFSFCVQITILLPLIPGMKKLERLWQFYKALTISVTAPRRASSGAKQVNRKNRTIYFLWPGLRPPCKETSWLPKRDVCGWWHWNEKNRCIKHLFTPAARSSAQSNNKLQTCVRQKQKLCHAYAGTADQPLIWRWSKLETANEKMIRF